MKNVTEPPSGRQDAATPFVKALARRSYRVRAGNRVELKLTRGRTLTAYSVTPLSTDFGGAAFRLVKMDGSGESYDLLVGGPHENCSCAGWCYREKCKHLDAIHVLLDLGVLSVAPASGAADDGGRAA